MRRPGTFDPLAFAAPRRAVDPAQFAPGRLVADGTGWAGVQPFEAGASAARVIPVGVGRGPALGPLPGGLTPEAAGLARILADIPAIRHLLDAGLLDGLDAGVLDALVDGHGTGAATPSGSSIPRRQWDAGTPTIPLPEVVGNVGPSEAAAGTRNRGLEDLFPAGDPNDPRFGGAWPENPDDARFGLPSHRDLLGIGGSPGPAPQPRDYSSDEQFGRALDKWISASTRYSDWLSRSGAERAPHERRREPPSEERIWEKYRYETEGWPTPPVPTPYGGDHDPLDEGGPISAFAAWLLSRFQSPGNTWAPAPSSGGAQINPGDAPEAGAVPASPAVVIDVSPNDAPSRLVRRAPPAVPSLRGRVTADFWRTARPPDPSRW